MSRIIPVNRKAKRIAASFTDSFGDAHALAPQDPPLGCTTIFAPGWEVDTDGGTSNLCTPIERDLYDCHHSCYWPAQVPDALTNHANWTQSCGAPVNDWSKIDLVFP